MKQSTGGRDETVSKSTINKTNRKVTNKSRHRSSKPNITSNKASDVSSENINLIKTTSAGITCKTSKLNSPSGSAAGLFHNVTTGEINTFNQQSYSNDSTASIAIGTSTGIKQEVSQGYLGSNCDENAMTGHSGDNILFTKSKSHTKNYVGLDPRSIKTIWEQHDQSDVELSNEVCSRVAEDVSHKLWELITNIKTYARHSGGVVTYDLVNEVLKDADVPPCLGALDNDWERIDYDGTFYFYSDKILELRDEYQREISFDVPIEKDFLCSWPIEEKHLGELQEYVPNMLYVILNGDEEDVDNVLTEVASSSLIGCSYRLILHKIIQIIAFRQSSEISKRCWRLLRSLSMNPQSRGFDCRLEYYNLSEVLICQLIAPYESIKISTSNIKQNDINMLNIYENQIKSEFGSTLNTVKIEPDIVETINSQQQQHNQQNSTEIFDSTQIWTNINEEKIYKLLNDEHDNDSEKNWPKQQSTNDTLENRQLPRYFATPVNAEYINELCDTLGCLSVINGYFQNECIHHINKRLKRFFDGRTINTERDYQYINRAICGLIALGGYAFRTFISYIYKLNASDIPEYLWTNLALAAVYLRNVDDQHLYEWLAFVCGADKLQPFMTYYANYYKKLTCYRYHKRKQATYYLTPKLSVRRLEWSTLVAAMCHGDDPNKPVKPKPTIKEAFPDLIIPKIRKRQCELNREIHFRFSGCRPVNIQRKWQQIQEISLTIPNNVSAISPTEQYSSRDSVSVKGPHQQPQQQHDIIIARRRLLKPLSNEKRLKNTSNFYCIQI